MVVPFIKIRIGWWRLKKSMNLKGSSIIYLTSFDSSFCLRNMAFHKQEFFFSQLFFFSHPLLFFHSSSFSFTSASTSSSSSSNSSSTSFSTFNSSSTSSSNYNSSSFILLRLLATRPLVGFRSGLLRNEYEHRTNSHWWRRLAQQPDESSPAAPKTLKPHRIKR